MKDEISHKSGFTIVELLIVIVVIGILAALVLNTYSGIQKRAHNASQLTYVKSVEKLIDAYKAENGYYPATDPADNGYCIGTKYPNDRCRDSYSPAYSYPQSDTSFTDQLDTVGSVSDNEKQPVHGSAGPFITVYSTSGFYLSGVLYAESCPSGFPSFWNDPDSDRIMCSKYYVYD